MGDPRDPAPELYEALTGQPLPPYAELRARYGDPGELPPVTRPVEIPDAAVEKAARAIYAFPTGRRLEPWNTVTGTLRSEYLRAGRAALVAARPYLMPIKHVCDPDIDHDHDPVPRVDFREMLTTDAAWSVKSRLEVALGRPYLATKLAEQLDPETAIRLCDRLDDLLRSAFDVARNQIAAEVSSAVDARIQVWQAEQDRRAKVVTRERFGPTRPE